MSRVGRSSTNFLPESRDGRIDLRVRDFYKIPMLIDRRKIRYVAGHSVGDMRRR